MKGRTCAGGPLRLALPLLAGLAALACAEPEPAPTAIDTRGLVTSIRAGTSPETGVVRVEGPPRPEVRHAKADVAIRPGTRIVARTGAGDRPAGFADLELGDRIEVRFDGPVAESWPVRGIAQEILILEKARGFAPSPAAPSPAPGAAPDMVPEPSPETMPAPDPGVAPGPSQSPPNPSSPAPAPSSENPLPPPPDPIDPPQAGPPPEIPVPGSIILRNVRTGDQQTFDRVVFDFEGSALPEYEIKYVSRAIQCGSGLPVRIAGQAFLQIRFTPAQAHTEAGAPTLPDRGRKLKLPVLREVRQICDFEGEVTWVLGLAGRTEHRVLELKDPARLVIDLPRDEAPREAPQDQTPQ